MGDKLVWALKNGSLDEVKAIVEVSMTSSLLYCTQITRIAILIRIYCIETRNTIYKQIFAKIRNSAHRN